MLLKRLGGLMSLWIVAAGAQAVDPRWPDFGVAVSERGNSGTASYFQGFESACFGPPYQPGAGETDWTRFYSEVARVATGSAGIASPSGFNHAEIRPPLPAAPGPNTGAFTRLGGYRTSFGGGYVIALDVYFDLSDPRVLSGINADYGWDASTAVNDQAGSYRRDFIFHTASNTSGQILVGASHVTNFVPIGSLSAGPHYVVSSSGWYTLEWVYRDAGDGSLAVDLNLRGSTGTLLFVRALNDPADVIATQVGGNRYLWFPFMQSNRLPIDNARLNSPVRAALYASSPVPGTLLDAGTGYLGYPAPGTSLNVQSEGTLRLEVCACVLTGAAAADFSIGNCPTLIEPGFNANLSIGCTPSAGGSRNATLTIATNDSLRGTQFVYPLQCAGDPDGLFADGFED